MMDRRRCGTNEVFKIQNHELVHRSKTLRYARHFMLGKIKGYAAIALGR
jgi:hypothetical protein